MSFDIADLEGKINALKLEGKILDAIDHYFADDCVFTEGDGSNRPNKAAQRAHLEGFFGSLQSFDGATLHGSAAQGNFSASEWTFKMTAGDGSAIVWNEVLIRTWRDGKVVSEKYYMA